ncbi:sugar-binding transcriptional regulator [Anaerotalea alkaliphila]|uniref:Sugar-binding transcriptional regulator n=1 Tax=Anaerotalea alkaliphila TaxID=2662126 RepID=A0A7X5HT67_9FIRM|nr:sugar-binding domain-containing protein [Anaerotalea alkaliphila]NDL66193.1 sugar-binding transcriptional regulator [Anaerotalea alkaliphila]
MTELLKILQKIMPKEMSALSRRYTLLHTIRLFQPIGRRLLSQKMRISEKVIRTDTELLKSEGLIDIVFAGMTLTEEGARVLDSLQELMRPLEELDKVREGVQTLLESQELYVVPGDSQNNQEAFKELGKEAARVLLEHLQGKSTVAITGGSTIRKVVEAIPFQKAPSPFPKLMVVPARGSLGNNAKIQANNLVAKMAERLQCRYRLLNLPDNLSRKSLDSVSQEPEIKEVFSLIRNADIVLFGIGIAERMVERRNLEPSVMEEIREKRAVAEVLGHYFDGQGNIVSTSCSIGLRLHELEQGGGYPIAVAGGADKAEAILAVRKYLRRGALVIDEGAAKRILALAAGSKTL